MTFDDVLATIEANKNERGMQNWQEMEGHTGLSSWGLGLTQLRKLAKQLGRDHHLAQQLWQSSCYDARVLGVLIDDPKAMSLEQAEQQVEQLAAGMLIHIYSSCDAPLSKTAFMPELIPKWIKSEDSTRRRCGYGLLYEYSKSTKKSAPEDHYFLDYIQHIDEHYDQEEPCVHLSMGTALMGMGKRSAALNQAALTVARRIGPIEVTSGKTKCDPFEVEKHLTSDYLKTKLGLD